MDENIVLNVRAVEIRDFVDIIYPECAAEVSQYNGDSEDAARWPDEIVALRIEISDEGCIFSIRTPLKLVNAFHESFKNYLRIITVNKAVKQSSRFDGQDILDFLRWYRTHDPEMWPISAAMAQDWGEEVTGRLRMYGTKETMEYLNGDPYFKVPRECNHIAASMRITD